MRLVDPVGEIVEQWRALDLGLDPSPMLIVGRIHRLGQIMDAALRPALAAAGLREGDFNILAALRRASPDDARTAGELHRALMVTTGAITKQVDRLAARGLVTRTAGAEDQRVRRIALTATGRRLVDELIVTHLETERELLSTLTAAQRAALADGLAILADGLEPR
jgi:DNA-binding MarR family transcriptional regulator